MAHILLSNTLIIAIQAVKLGKTNTLLIVSEMLLNFRIPLNNYLRGHYWRATNIRKWNDIHRAIRQFEGICKYICCDFNISRVLKPVCGTAILPCSDIFMHYRKDCASKRICSMTTNVMKECIMTSEVNHNQPTLEKKRNVLFGIGQQINCTMSRVWCPLIT